MIFHPSDATVANVVLHYLEVSHHMIVEVCSGSSRRQPPAFRFSFFGKVSSSLFFCCIPSALCKGDQLREAVL